MPCAGSCTAPSSVCDVSDCVDGSADRLEGHTATSSDACSITPSGAGTWGASEVAVIGGCNEASASALPFIGAVHSSLAVTATLEASSLTMVLDNEDVQVVAAAVRAVGEASR